eukprot:TRINITY_DN13056_c0_g1_i1.p1 TRINITY_DN13056_c0_g1~~TRINITY_DN13056_c0_g1_i1.p1  ORF type:complete len:164 (-),score=28.87 TRINITY_DN13056_c0_g1_i1:73-564(-)
MNIHTKQTNPSSLDNLSRNEWPELFDSPAVERAATPISRSFERSGDHLVIYHDIDSDNVQSLPNQNFNHNTEKVMFLPTPVLGRDKKQAFRLAPLTHTENTHKSEIDENKENFIIAEKFERESNETSDPLHAIPLASVWNLNDDRRVIRSSDSEIKLFPVSIY